MPTVSATRSPSAKSRNRSSKPGAEGSTRRTPRSTASTRSRGRCPVSTRSDPNRGARGADRPRFRAHGAQTRQCCPQQSTGRDRHSTQDSPLRHRPSPSASAQERTSCEMHILVWRKKERPRTYVRGGGRGVTVYSSVCMRENLETWLIDDRPVRHHLLRPGESQSRGLISAHCAKRDEATQGRQTIPSAVSQRSADARREDATGRAREGTWRRRRAPRATSRRRRPHPRPAPHPLPSTPPSTPRPRRPPP